MDDATVQRKRIPKLDEMAGRLPSMHDASEPNTPQNNKVLDALYVAYADGLEKAAKMLDNMDAETHEFAGQTFDDGGKTLTVASRNIRQHAKEMGHE